MTLGIKKWDTAEFLTTPEHVVEYLRVSLEEDDSAAFQISLGNVARSKGMAEIAKKAGVSRQALYRALSAGGDPALSTLRGVLDALGLKLDVSPKHLSDAAE